MLCCCLILCLNKKCPDITHGTVAKCYHGKEPFVLFEHDVVICMELLDIDKVLKSAPDADDATELRQHTVTKAIIIGQLALKEKTAATSHEYLCYV